MAVSQHTLIVDNTSSPAATGQFGPLNVTVSNNLLRVRAVGSYISPAVTLTYPFTATNDTTWGVQYGPAGYTPKVLPANIDDPAWLVVNQRRDAPTNTAYAPSTATAVYQYSAGLDLEWNGQLGLYSSIDFYLTYGGSHGGGQTAVVAGTLQVWEE